MTQGVEAVTVSMDGPQEVHDAIRGQQDAFRKTTAGLRALVAARERARRPGPIITINCVISKASLATLDQLVPLAQDLGADILQIQHTIFNTAANVQWHNRNLSPEFAAEQGLDLAPPSIPAGEYYESAITAADLPLLVDQLQKIRRLAPGRVKPVFLPNLPVQFAETLLPGPGPRIPRGLQRPLEGLPHPSGRHRLALPAPFRRQHRLPTVCGNLERPPNAPFPADHLPPALSRMRPLLQPELYLNVAAPNSTVLRFSPLSGLEIQASGPCGDIANPTSKEGSMWHTQFIAWELIQAGDRRRSGRRHRL